MSLPQRPVLAERPFHPRHGVLPEGAIAARRVTINLAESPLAWLFSRKFISALQLQAGERLRTDYERAQLPPMITMNWEATPIGKGQRVVSPKLDPSLVPMAAKQRFDAAILALGKGLSDIAWRVICAGDALPVAEKAMHWPARAGRVVLTLALDRLVDHYRL